MGEYYDKIADNLLCGEILRSTVAGIEYMAQSIHIW